MKAISIKVIGGCLLFAFFAVSSSGQTTKTSKEDKKMKSKVEKNKVPKEVTEMFYDEYPIRNYEYWYSYPANDYVNDWYYNWYDYSPYVYSDYPEYYMVEFSKDSISHKAIYSKAGKKIAIRKKLNSKNVPMAVSTAINKGEYKTWKIGSENEEIFKGNGSDQMKVYKVDVERGTEKHILFFQPDGHLLKDKKVS